MDQRVVKKVDALSHQTVVLEARWNNLSTKELAERIIGQLEQIYAPSKVTNDIVLLNEHAQATKTKLADYDTCINSITQLLAEVKTVVWECKMAGQARRSEDAEEQCLSRRPSAGRRREHQDANHFCSDAQSLGNSPLLALASRKFRFGFSTSSGYNTSS
jgi:hypothetical protein